MTKQGRRSGVAPRRTIHSGVLAMALVLACVASASAARPPESGGRTSQVPGEHRTGAASAPQAPSLATRAQRLVDAADRSSPLMDRWSEARIGAAVEPALRAALEARGCALAQDPDRYFAPAYRSYYDTLHAGFVKQARADRESPHQRAAMAPLAWAVDQLDAAQYQQTLDWFTAARMRSARQYYDLFTAIGDMQRGALAGARGEPSFALLFDFKEAVDAAGLTPAVADAIRRLDAAQAEVFLSVDRNAAAPAERRAQWAELLRGFARNGAALSAELFNHTLTQAERDAMLSFNHGRYTEALAVGATALHAWRVRDEAGQAPANDQERLGRDIDRYFGKPIHQYAADPATDPERWLRTQAVRYLDEHRDVLCPR